MCVESFELDATTTTFTTTSKKSLEKHLRDISTLRPSKSHNSVQLPNPFCLSFSIICKSRIWVWSTSSGFTNLRRTRALELDLVDHGTMLRCCWGGWGLSDLNWSVLRDLGTTFNVSGSKIRIYKPLELIITYYSKSARISRHPRNDIVSFESPC